MSFIIVFDDDANQIEAFSSGFKAIGINSELIKCKTIEEFRQTVNDDYKLKNTVCMIFDLAKDEKETGSTEFEITSDIIENYNKNRIPLIIHSGHLNHFDKFHEKGTVFKFEKGKDSVEDVCTTIKLLEETGFLNLFCQNGVIENKIMKELHASFTEQFQRGELVGIIENIKNTESANYKERISEVFERISIRSMFQNLVSAKKISDDLVDDIKVNSVEHYYRRRDGYKYWTGDIFKNIKTGNLIVILTPRCDLAHSDKMNILTCEIEKLSDNLVKELSSDSKKLREYIVDNATRTGYKTRLLPKTPLFEGGKINFSKYHSIPNDILQKGFEYQISLSDELTNDIVRKFSSYLMRSGISETDVAEAIGYFKLLNEKQ